MKRKLQTIYRKNKEDFRALIFEIYPQFVYKNIHRLPENDIPIFVFHSVRPDYFEHQMRHLAENNYTTLTSDELCNIIKGNTSSKPNNIALTFDDGLASLWTTAYPILKKFGLSATCFILPSWIKNGPALSPSIEDVWRSKTDFMDIKKREIKEPLCNWQEIKHMHESGVIDFQSHTSFHHSIFISPTIVDFVNPDFKPSFLLSDLNPVVKVQGRDSVPDHLEWGFPIYEWAPAMSPQKRYIEDERLGSYCIQCVRQNGGISFFDRPGWRNELRACVADYKKKNECTPKYISSDERFNEIYQDLHQSRKAIEENLNKKVTHLCYPWYIGSDQSVQASKEAGYESNHWGILDSRSTNPIGVDPYYLARMSDDYLLTVPGNGRHSIIKILEDKMIRICEKNRPFSYNTELLGES